MNHAVITNTCTNHVFSLLPTSTHMLKDELGVEIIALNNISTHTIPLSPPSPPHHPTLSPHPLTPSLSLPSHHPPSPLTPLTPSSSHHPPHPLTIPQLCSHPLTPSPSLPSPPHHSTTLPSPPHTIPLSPSLPSPPHPLTSDLDFEK